MAEQVAKWLDEYDNGAFRDCKVTFKGITGRGMLGFTVDQLERAASMPRMKAVALYNALHPQTGKLSSN
jgi:hypothetical protein